MVCPFVCHVALGGYLEVSSVQSSSEVLPDLHQFWSWASWTCTLFDWILLQVCQKLAFPQQQLSEVICTHENICLEEKKKVYHHHQVTPTLLAWIELW